MFFFIGCGESIRGVPDTAWTWTSLTIELRNFQFTADGVCADTAACVWALLRIIRVREWEGYALG